MLIIEGGKEDAFPAQAAKLTPPQRIVNVLSMNIRLCPDCYSVIFVEFFHHKLWFNIAPAFINPGYDSVRVLVLSTCTSGPAAGCFCEGLI